MCSFYDAWYRIAFGSIFLSLIIFSAHARKLEILIDMQGTKTFCTTQFREFWPVMVIWLAKEVKPLKVRFRKYQDGLPKKFQALVISPHFYDVRNRETNLNINSSTAQQISQSFRRNSVFYVWQYYMSFNASCDYFPTFGSPLENC